MPADPFLETFLLHLVDTPWFNDVTFFGVPDKSDEASGIPSPLVSGAVSSLYCTSPHSPPREK